MKYDHRHINELGDLELVQAYQNCRQAEARRLEASKDQKFDKINNKKAMEFPPINPEFLNIKNALHTEMKNRNIEVEE